MFSLPPRVFLGALLLTVYGLVSATDGSVHSGSARQSRYPYCNVYTVTACFGVSGGDELRMSMPADFTLYDITLPSSVKVRIYLGYNPETEIFESAKPCELHGDSSRCGYVTSPSTWDVLYEGVGNQPALHVHIEGQGSVAKQIAHDFLGNFRPCAEKGAGLSCTDKRIFSGID